MRKVALILAAFAAVSAHAQTATRTTPKMALDLNVECVSLLGENFYRTPAEGDALKALERRLEEAQRHAEAQPDNPAAHIARGRALESLWRYHDAAQAHSKAIALNPADAAAYIARANAFMVLRLFDQSRADFEHATAIDPASYDAWYGLGLAQWMTGKFALAAEAFAMAFNLGGDAQRVADAGELNNIAAARAGDESLKVVLGGDPAKRTADDPFAMYLASLNKRVNDPEGALQDWKMIAVSYDWTQLGVIAAEAEIAAIEGSKKMNSTRYSTGP